VSKNPLRRLAEQITLTSMRPPITETLKLYRPGATRIDLAGKRILLTGASSGIGESAAEEFARLGCAVVGVDPSEESLAAARTHAAP